MREFDYCERLDASFWAEPLNAMSNLFFLVSAYCVYQYMKKKRVEPSVSFFVSLLAFILVCIGIGSFLWHSFATLWSELADVIPITLFIYTYLFVFVLKVLEKSYFLAVMSLLLFTLFNYLFGVCFSDKLLNGSIAYFPALLILVLLSYLIKEEKEFSLMLKAIGIFMLSIVFRSVDFMVCDLIHFGTHFLWHVLNAYMLYLLVQLLILKKAPR